MTQIPLCIPCDLPTVEHHMIAPKKSSRVQTSSSLIILSCIDGQSCIQMIVGGCSDAPASNLSATQRGSIGKPQTYIVKGMTERRGIAFDELPSPFGRGVASTIHERGLV